MPPIFRAAQAPDVGPCFMPPVALIVLAIEAAALWAWNRPASLAAAAACSLGMNAASSTGLHRIVMLRGGRPIGTRLPP